MSDMHCYSFSLYHKMTQQRLTGEVSNKGHKTSMAFSCFVLFCFHLFLDAGLVLEIILQNSTLPRDVCSKQLLVPGVQIMSLAKQLMKLSFARKNS